MENIELEPYQLRELDKLYLEKCEEVNKLSKELSEHNAGPLPLEGERSTRGPRRVDPPLQPRKGQPS